jgi:hypothetical protein
VPIICSSPILVLLLFALPFSLWFGWVFRYFIIVLFYETSIQHFKRGITREMKSLNGLDFFSGFWRIPPSGGNIKKSVAR